MLRDNIHTEKQSWILYTLNTAALCQVREEKILFFLKTKYSMKDSYIFKYLNIFVDILLLHM